MLMCKLKFNLLNTRKYELQTRNRLPLVTNEGQVRLRYGLQIAPAENSLLNQAHSQFHKIFQENLRDVQYFSFFRNENIEKSTTQ